MSLSNLLPSGSNPLRDVLPAKYRKVVYALIGLASIGWGVYQASDGDWRSLVGGLVVALTQLTAASNTNVASSPTEE